MDQMQETQCLDVLKKEAEHGKTMVIVTHKPALLPLVDRIIVVGEGKIVADTTPDELLAANVLAEEGIREPLYITALKHAGCEIRPETHPAHVETMELSGYKEALCRWNEKVALPEKRDMSLN
jgi:energy-coupling factor transport system ATP-binding protein